MRQSPFLPGRTWGNKNERIRRELSSDTSAVNASEREWKAIVVVIHRIAAERFKTFEELRAATIARIAEGKLNKSHGGYKHVPGTNISVQLTDANASWRSTLHLASQLKIPVEVTVMWRNTPKAAYPGEMAQLSWIPS